MKLDSSFRDNRGYVLNFNGHILRKINKIYEKTFFDENFKNIVNLSIKNKYLVNSKQINFPNNDENFYIHKKIKFITYPYEWNFHQLKEAALFHLNFQIFLLKHNYKLRDATAYNIQFIKNKPIFIDLLSIDKYEEGEPWFGYNQFCSFFLFPLLIQNKKKINFNTILSSSMEGIDVFLASKLLGIKMFTSINMLLHVFLNNKFQNKTLIENDINKKDKILNQQKISRHKYQSILNNLYNYISNLHINSEQTSIWSNYEKKNFYTSISVDSKYETLNKALNYSKPKSIIDMGCNTGKYSIFASKQGYKSIISFDLDFKSLESLYIHSKSKNLDILPIYFNPLSPLNSCGWKNKEREFFENRISCEFLICYAFLHHLCIGGNTPLIETLKWITQFASKGVVEFVPKTDPAVEKLMQMKEDLYDEYNEENFINFFKENFSVVSINKVNETNRLILHYEK